MGGCDLLKYNGGDSGIKISVLYWRRSVIRVSVIRGSTVVSSVTEYPEMLLEVIKNNLSSK